MPFREWAKKHIHRNDSSEDESVPAQHGSPRIQVQVVRSDTMGITPLQIPESGGYHIEKGATPPRSSSPSPKSPNKLKRLSGFGRNRSSSQTSLPDWNPPDDSDPNAESSWEARATTLARLRPTSLTASQENLANLAKLSVKDDSPPGRAVTSADGHLLPEPKANIGWAPAAVVEGMSADDALQEAIRLHEAGELEKATDLFKKIAEQPKFNDNQVLGQLLYGLALRHGWGCKADMSKAVVYLKAAAETAAEAEADALAAGLTKGGQLKGELTLAIYELGNCFRNGWGVDKDNKAARQYFETAAHLGDPEAGNEAAWHWMNGVGCKRDKKQAAKYYRLAEQGGIKIVGNSWIWKDKYN